MRLGCSSEIPPRAGTGSREQQAKEGRPISPSSHDPLSHGGAEAADPDYFVVQGAQQLRRLAAEILDERERPIVGLALDADGLRPVLAPSDVRALVGPAVRIYLICGDDLLAELAQAIGPRLALEPAAARIWWPGARVRCDPAAHPLVMALEDERPRDTLEELTRQFELSRPLVRRQITLVEDARAFLEQELARAEEHNRVIHERLRDAQVDCHRLRIRAEAAEASLAAALQQSRLD